jgi:tRNA(fMet)-specific endonuclease VapC
MVMSWLLDSNIWIHYLKNRHSSIALHLQQNTPLEIFSCAIVKAELLHGAMKYGVPERRLAIVRETLAPYVSLPFDDLAADHYFRIRHDLEISGNIIGPHDLFIAAICRAHRCVLVTANTGEFVRIAGLNVENWLSA